jgi:hypothetical protein
LKSNPGSTYEPTFLQNLMKDFIIWHFAWKLYSFMTTWKPESVLPII